ncbi:MAG: RNase P subunit p30 family protein [Thermofilum sp.]|jgi:RNase P/RNase MRP subunit p30|nr:RNase P subunit p30 family protein [Thermofilum sp.]
MSKKPRFIDAYATEIPIEKLKEVSLDEILNYAFEVYSLARKTGYYGCVIAARFSKYSRNIRAYSKRLDEAIATARENGVNCFSRCHIEASQQSEFKRILKAIRFNCDLISTSPQNRQLMAFSSRDHRIDILTLIPGKIPPFYSGDLKEIKSQEKFVEITVASLFTNNTLDPHRLGILAEILKVLGRKEIAVIVSTGPLSPYAPRDPRSLLSFTKIFLGLDQAKLAKDLSQGILKRITENQYKRAGKMPVRGVLIEG